jgi:hypothetical protein
LGALSALTLIVAACTPAGEPEPATTTDAPPQATTTERMDEGPATSPAEIVFEAQSSDGTSIVVASVTLPAPGFVAVHSNADGKPGAVIGNSELLPAGTSTDVVVTLDQPLEATDMVFPMVHIDIDGDGEYTFAPPYDLVDTPATTADGGVAVTGAEVTVEG